MKLFLYAFLMAMVSYTGTCSVQLGNENTTVGPPGSGDCDFDSIQDALDSVIPGSDNVFVHVVEGTYNDTIQLIDMSATIIGGFSDCQSAANGVREPGTSSTLDPIAHGILIDARFAAERQTINLIGINVSNGLPGSALTPSGGGNVYGDVNVHILESRISNNVGIDGGGLYAVGPAHVTLQDTVIEDNEALSGGGIYCDGCIISIHGNSGISNNQANGDLTLHGGGGLYLINNAQATISSGSHNPSMNNFGIHSNSAKSCGGGVKLDSSELWLYGDVLAPGLGNASDPVNITKNAARSGGGLCITNGSTVNATVINLSENESETVGGGISIAGNSVLNINLDEFNIIQDKMLDSCWTSDRTKCNQISDNEILNGSSPNGQGGAIYSIDSEITIDHVWFQGNHAGEGVGAMIYYANGFGSDLNIRNSTMYNNGHPTGQDLNMTHVIASRANFINNTIADNNIADEIFLLAGGDGNIYTVSNSIVHNENAGTILTRAITGGGNPPTIRFTCVLLHDDTNLPVTSLSQHFVGNPAFHNRSEGDLHLTSESVLAIDKCMVQPGFIEKDFDLEDRSVDLSDYDNNPFFYADIGADEYSSCTVISTTDTLFYNGFEGDDCLTDE